jgi:hypothetical protein
VSSFRAAEQQQVIVQIVRGALDAELPEPRDRVLGT